MACLCVLFRILHSNILFLNLGYDCGVFTCMFGDYISKDCRLLFNLDNIDQCRERIALSIMTNCAIEEGCGHPVHSRKKQTTATVAIAESIKDLGTLSCYDCGANLCMGGGWWEEKNADVCKNCKAKLRNMINFDPPSLAGSMDEKVEKDVESVGSSGDDSSKYLPNEK